MHLFHPHMSLHSHMDQTHTHLALKFHMATYSYITYSVYLFFINCNATKKDDTVNPFNSQHRFNLAR